MRGINIKYNELMGECHSTRVFQKIFIKIVSETEGPQFFKFLTGVESWLTVNQAAKNMLVEVLRKI